jgi:hypothetical protein
MSPIVPEPNSTRLPGSGVDGAADFLNRLVRADQRSVRQLESVQREVSEPDRVFVDFIYGASEPAPLFQMAEAAICCNLIALRPTGGRRPKMNFSPVVDNYSQSPGFSDGSRIRSGSGRNVSGTSNTCWPVNSHKRSSCVGAALVSCSVPDT